MLTGSNGIWPNANDILTAAICKVQAPVSCQERLWGKTLICPSSGNGDNLAEGLTTSRQSTILLSLSSGRLAKRETLAQRKKQMMCFRWFRCIQMQIIN